MEFSFENIDGICEATPFEMSHLREEYMSFGYEWTRCSAGKGITLGRIDDMPIVASFRNAIVQGKKILFWNATSQVVDYRVIEKWFSENYPVTRKTDAVNLVNLL